MYARETETPLSNICLVCAFMEYFCGCNVVAGLSSVWQTLKDAGQELRDARRDGRLGEELSEQAKESSGRLQVRSLCLSSGVDPPLSFPQRAAAL